MRNTASQGAPLSDTPNSTKSSDVATSTKIATGGIAQFAYPRSVRFVDTDLTGNAHFSTYVRMMEETEYAFLRSCGLNVKLTDERGTMGFPRLHASLQILLPLSFNEQVTVGLRLTDLDGKAIGYQFQICDDAGRVRATGQFKVALCRFPKDQPPYAILTPDYVIEALQNGPSLAC